MIGYGAWAVGTFERARYLQLQHVTFRTDGVPFVRPVEVLVPREEILEKWEIISARIVPKMQAAARTLNPLDIEPNLNACEKYGGCAFYEKCFSPMARLRARLKKSAPGV